MISDAQIDEFERIGAVTIDTPFTTEQLDAASTTFDRLLPPPGEGADRDSFRVSRTNDFFNPQLLLFIEHPFTEAVCQRALRAEQVQFWASAIVKTHGQPGLAPQYWQHVDIKYSMRDLEAEPRRMLCSCLLWLTDVTEDRAPLMYRPGSHRQIAAVMDKHPAHIENPVGVDELPDLPYADPTPLLTRRGQMTVCTTAMIHGASINTGQLARKVIFILFHPRGCDVPANMDMVEQRNRYLRKLHEHFRPGRRHILPPVE